MVTSVLFVCTGNTCRSVMAEYLFRHQAEKVNLEVDVASVGIQAFAGDTASENTLAALAEVGIDGSGHRSRRIHHLLLNEYDLILAMTNSHKQQLLQLAPDLQGKIFLLKEFVKQGQELDAYIEKAYDIADPFGGSLEVYRTSLGEIAQATQALVNHLAYGKEKKMKIVIGADHGGYLAKQAIIEYLQGQGYKVEDLGTHSEESCDYPDIAKEVAKAVAQEQLTLGVLICGTGIGMSIAANKVPGIRASLCHDTYSARMTRAHNDSNILCLGARVTGLGLMFDIVDAYLQSSFIGGRHATRVEKIEQL